MTKIFFTLFLCASSLFGGDFYGIIIADTEVENIGDHVFYDYVRMNRQMTKIARNLDREFKQLMFYDEDFVADEIIKQIDKLELNDDDIVFFYYSGHGQQAVEHPYDPWPLLKLGGRLAMGFSTITTKLLEKNPRLVVAMADCCNHQLSIEPIELHFPQPKGNDHKEAEKGLIRKNTRKLFLDQKGLIMSSSSKALESSWSGMMGSYYTLYLTQALYYELRENDTSWGIIFERTTERLEDKQHPQYLMIPSNEEALSILKILMN